MYLVSKFRNILLVGLAVLVLSVGVLSIQPTAADATPAVQVNVMSNVALQATNAAMIAEKPTLIPALLIGAAVIGGGIWAVNEYFGDAIDCAKKLPECIDAVVRGFSLDSLKWSSTKVTHAALSIEEECFKVSTATDAAARTREAERVKECQDGIVNRYVVENVSDDRINEIKDQLEEEKDARLETIDTQLNDPNNASSSRQNRLIDEKEEIESWNIDEMARDMASRPAGSGFTVREAPISTANFDREYRKYVYIGFMIMIPMLMAGAIQALITGKPHLMLKSVLIHVPLAGIAAMATVPVTKLIMIITDQLSAWVISDSTNDMEQFLSISNNTEVSTVSLLPLLFVSLAFLFGAILIWFIMNLRSAAILMVTALMPLAVAASVWPALSKWALRAIKLLIATIISKLFITGAIALGIGIMANPGEQADSFGNLLYGATVFVVAAFSPAMVMRFFDEIGDALNAGGSTGMLNRGLGILGNVNGTLAMKGTVAGLRGGRGGGLTPGGLGGVGAGAGGGGAGGGGAGGGGAGGGGGPAPGEADASVASQRWVQSPLNRGATGRQVTAGARIAGRAVVGGAVTALALGGGAVPAIAAYGAYRALRKIGRPILHGAAAMSDTSRNNLNDLLRRPR